MYQWLARRLAHPQAVWWLSALAFVASLPAIATGLVADDFMIEASVARDPWSAFIFSASDAAVRSAQLATDRALGLRPWWTDLDGHQAFLRPLASLWHALDFKLWADAVWVMHLENSILFALIVWLAGAIYRELELPAPALGFATFFYIWSGSFGVAVSWISARNTLSCAVFGLLAIWLHERANRLARPALTLAAAAALGCGLLHGEFACGAFGFLLASALTLRDGPVVERLAALWPYALVLGVWQFVYITGGYGAFGSGFYHGPAQEPGAFALAALTGLPIYLASALTVPFATAACFFPGALAAVTALSLVVLFALRNLLAPLLRVDRRVRYFALGAALATFPLGATVPQDRLAFFVVLGAAASLGMIVVARLDVRNQSSPRAGAFWLFRLHALYLPALFVPLLFANSNVNAVGGGLRALDRALPNSGDRGAVLVNAPADLLAYPQNLMRRREGRPEIPWIYILYSGAQPVEVTRPSERSLELDVDAGYFAATIERINRNPARHPMHAGDVVQLPNMSVSVLAVNSDGAPTRVRAEFPVALEKLAADWLYWDGKLAKPWTLPRVGGHASLAPVYSFL